MSFVSQYLNFIVPAIAIVVGLWFLSRPMRSPTKTQSVRLFVFR